MLQKSLKIPKRLSENEIKEGHTIQWAKEKWQKGQTIIYKKHFTENTRSSNMNTTKTRDKLGCSERVNSSCSTCGTHHKPVVIIQEWGKHRSVNTTNRCHIVFWPLISWRQVQCHIIFWPQCQISVILLWTPSR